MKWLRWGMAGKEPVGSCGSTKPTSDRPPLMTRISVEWVMEGADEHNNFASTAGMATQFATYRMLRRFLRSRRQWVRKI